MTSSTADTWIWGDETHVSRSSKVNNYLTARFNTSDNAGIRNYRFACFSLWLAHEIYSLQDDRWSTNWTWLTTWGWYFYGAYISTISFYHLRFDVFNIE